jgi:predicted negative regulator of RcsB-dependent stress response
MRTVPRPRSAFVLAVLALVGLASWNLAAAQTYWFESYQRAVELIDAGRTQEAARLLEPLIQDHPFPVAGVRIPGSQLLDYFPYYQLARVQVMEGNHEAALRNLDICEAFGAVKQRPRALSELTDLRRQAAAAIVRKAERDAVVSASSR